MSEETETGRVCPVSCSSSSSLSGHRCSVEFSTRPARLVKLRRHPNPHYLHPAEKWKEQGWSFVARSINTRQINQSDKITLTAQRSSEHGASFWSCDLLSFTATSRDPSLRGVLLSLTPSYWWTPSVCTLQVFSKIKFKWLNSVEVSFSETHTHTHPVTVWSIGTQIWGTIVFLFWIGDICLVFN